jgi:hypothetical protein
MEGCRYVPVLVEKAAEILGGVAVDGAVGHQKRALKAVTVFNDLSKSPG